VAKFVKGDVVVVPFPFSDLTQTKRRPAFVLAVLEGNDLILCQITSKMIKDRYAVSIGDDDFSAGALKQISNVRPNRFLPQMAASFFTESVPSTIRPQRWLSSGR
jgi:mRNA interferase MazF